MKFIVDAQLPRSICSLLPAKGFDSTHTLDLPQQNNTPDSGINTIAATENRVVITKDNDFLDNHLLGGKPPKLMIVTTGNIRNAMLLAIFEQHLNTIIQMLQRTNLIEINRTEIISHTA